MGRRLTLANEAVCRRGESGRHASGGEARETFARRAAILLGLAAHRVSGAELMGHCKGKDNVKKRAVRRKKAEALVLAKSKAKAPAL